MSFVFGDVPVVPLVLGAPLVGSVLLFVALSCASKQGARSRRKRQIVRERQRRAFWGFE